MFESFSFAVNILFILLMGFLTSYEDMRKNRISNKYIGLAVAVAFLTNVVGSLLEPAPDESKLLYVQTTLINAFLSFLVGLLLWRLRMWRAGDGKLFFAYSFLLPISAYYYGFTPYFPSFAILINSLIPVFIILLWNVWVATSSSEKLEILKRTLHLKSILYMLLSLISMQWLILILFSWLSVDVASSAYLAMLLLLISSNSVQELLYEISPPLVLLRLLLDSQFLSYSFLTQSLLPFIVFVIALAFITNLASFRFNERVKITHLKPNMCCVDRIARKGRFYERVAAAGSALKLNYDALTEDDIKKLKEMSRKGKLKFDEIIIRQTIPFAPFLFLGVLLTLVLKGDVITYLKLLFS
ncbi:MAG: hypothetical protein QXF56_03280 [Candidatus Micrarchaeia archaeon]